MKKIFYIILVIVILLVAGRLLKDQTAETVPATATTVEHQPVVAEDENGNMTVDGEIVEDVEEENPEATANQEETIIQE